MSAVQRITERLLCHPELVYRVSVSTITVEPPTPNGFAMSLTEAAGEWVVRFDGWHEHFGSEDEAVSCFLFGLSDRCRLRIQYRGSLPSSWTLEERTGEGWQADSTTGLLLFKFWRRPRVEYRQNAVMRTAVQANALERGSQAD
jgi:hypothetical protein